MNEYASHALRHFRDVFQPERRAPAESERAVMLQNLGLPGCVVCQGSYRRRAWLLEPKDARA